MRHDSHTTGAKCRRKTRLCVSTFLSLHSYLFPNPRLHSRLLLVPRRPFVSFLRPQVLTCHLSVFHTEGTGRRDHLSFRHFEKEKGERLGANLKEYTRASEIDKHQLAGDTNLPNPFKIFPHQCPAPATAAHCQRKESVHRRK